MPLVNRLLDVFFRTLDVVDAARERVDRALGRQVKPEPWTTEWSPVPEPPTNGSAPAAMQVPVAKPATKAPPAAKEREAPAKKKTAAKKAPPAKTGKRGGTNRKGSVDKKGADIDSPRAKAILEKLKETPGAKVLAEEATYSGKKVLARVLWALSAADSAGSELGLTAVDASALLHLAAGLEVFATNVARTCRDETDLIEESAPDGRSKRYKLTDAGRTAASKLDVRPLS